MTCKHFIWTGALACLLAVGARPAPAIIYVNLALGASGDGDSWATAYNHLEDALDDADVGTQEIWISSGTLTLTAQIDVATTHDGARIYGGFAGNEPGGYDKGLRDLVTNETVIDADGDPADRRVFEIDGTDGLNLVLDGLTITGGYFSDATPNQGAGLWIYDGAVVALLNCAIDNNDLYESNTGPDETMRGAGMLVEDSTLTLTTCTISGNNTQTATGTGEGNSVYGGGLHLSESDATLANCEFFDNSAQTRRSKTNSEGMGGAIYANASGGADKDLAVTDCVFRSNRAQSAAERPNIRGAGVYLSGANQNASFSNCSFAANEGVQYNALDGCRAYGSGIAAVGSNNLLIDDCRFGNNRTDAVTGAQEGGTALTLNAAVTTMTRSLVCGNYGNTRAHAIDCDNSVYIANCLIAGNENQSAGGSWPASALVVKGGATVIENTTFADNQAGSLANASVYVYGGTGDLTNCIVSGETIGYGVRNNATMSLTNCLLYDNNSGHIDGTVTQTDVITDEDPNYDHGLTGSVTGAYDGGTKLTTLTDAGAPFPAGDLAGTLVALDGDRTPPALILSNTASELVIAGNWSGATSYELLDYDLAYPSGAIDQGTDTGIPNDIEGTARADAGGVLPNGGAPYDIGAYEFAGAFATADRPLGASYDFGDWVVGWPAVPQSTALTLLCAGTQSFTVTTASMSVPADFTLSVSQGLPAVFNPGDSVTIDVGFDPLTAGAKAGNLLVDTTAANMASVQVTLAGDAQNNSLPVFSGATVAKSGGFAGQAYADTLTTGATIAAGIDVADGDFDIAGGYETLRFAIGGHAGPGGDWLSLDPDTGELTGNPTEAHRGTHTWTLEATDYLTGTRTATLEIEVDAPGSEVRHWTRY